MTSVAVVYSCSSRMVTVTWDSVFGANLYRATAVDGTGASLNCTSASDSCQVTMLKCGEQYRVHVTAISDDCESIANTSTVFETGECGLDGLRPTPSHLTLLPSHTQIHSSMSSWPGGILFSFLLLLALTPFSQSHPLISQYEWIPDTIDL